MKNLARLRNNYSRIALALLALSALGIPAGAAPYAQGSPPQILQEILHSSHRFAQSHDHAYFQRFQGEQHPRVTLLGCSDSRAHAVAFSADPVDQIFSVRNIGNQIYNSFGSVDYGVYYLKTPILLVLGHTHCGAVKAALSEYNQASFAIVREVDHLAAHLRQHKQVSAPFETFWLESVQRNVDYQVQVALRRYAPEIAKGQLTVVGAVYDFINGYGQGEGRLILVNLNGEKDVQKILQSPLLAGVEASLRQRSVQRLKYSLPLASPPSYSH